MIKPLVDELASHTNVKTACDLLGRPRGSHYRAKAPKPARAAGPDDAAERAQRGRTPAGARRVDQ
ncbi:MAG: hypothetical protein IPH27_03055 [Actinomycetales bacterium]|nr:hypothetical protein [Candidatus Phosphoribacter baldrii]